MRIQIPSPFRFALSGGITPALSDSMQIKNMKEELVPISTADQSKEVTNPIYGRIKTIKDCTNMSFKRSISAWFCLS